MRRSGFVACSLLLHVLIFSPRAKADPITYKIEYTLLQSSTVYGTTLPGAPLPTIFTFDPNTSFFSGVTVRWPSTSSGSPSTVQFIVACPVEDPFPWSNPFTCFLGSAINNWNFYSPATRQQILSGLLSGGTWEIYTTIEFTNDVYISSPLGSGVVLGGGNNMGDTAKGTFATTAVPESSSLLLLGFGLAVVVAVKLRTRLQG
jgi:hypothetical protein